MNINSTSRLELDLPNGSKCLLRPVTAEDEPLLLRIYASTREEEMAQADMPEDAKRKFLLWQMGLQRQEYESRYPDATYDIIMLDGEPAGRFWVGRDEEQIRLMDIAILPEFQNRGIGTVLVRHLMEEARSVKKLLRHMVFVLNNDGQRFYDRLGFVVIEDLGAYRHMEWRPDN